MKLTKEYIREKVKQSLINLSEQDEELNFVDDDYIMNNLIIQKTKTPFKLKKGGVVVYWGDDYEYIVKSDPKRVATILLSTDEGEEILGKVKLAPMEGNLQKQISTLKKKIIKIMKTSSTKITKSKLKEIIQQEILRIKEISEKVNDENEITEDEWEMINTAVNVLTRNYSKVHKSRLSPTYDIDDLIEDSMDDKGIRDEIIRRDKKWLRTKFPKIFRNKTLKSEFDIAFQSEMEAGRYT